MNNNLYLDAQDPKHTAGRYVNCGRGDNNATFGAGRTATYDPIRKQWWISVYASKNIPAGEEILVPYSASYKFPQKKNDGKPAMASRPVPTKDTQANEEQKETKSKGGKRCELTKIVTTAKKMTADAIYKAKQKAIKKWQDMTQYMQKTKSQAIAWITNSPTNPAATKEANPTKDEKTTGTQRNKNGSQAQHQRKDNKAKTQWQPILTGSIAPNGEPKLEACLPKVMKGKEESGCEARNEQKRNPTQQLVVVGQRGETEGAEGNTDSGSKQRKGKKKYKEEEPGKAGKMAIKKIPSKNGNMPKLTTNLNANPKIRTAGQQPEKPNQEKTKPECQKMRSEHDSQRKRKIGKNTPTHISWAKK